MKNRKSKITKATIIPALCALTMALPQKANANWGVGIGYLFSGLLRGTGTAVAANSCKSRTTLVHHQPQYHVQPQPVYVQQPQPVYVQQPQQSYVPVVQPQGYEDNQETYAEDVSVRRVIRRRVIRRTVTTQQGYGQPVVEEIIEEIPANQQYVPQHYEGHSY